MKIAVVCLLALLVSGVLSCGSGGDFNSGRNYFWMITNDGNRTFQAYFPPAYTGSEAYPMVLVLHGGGSTGATAENLYGMDGVAASEKFITVYPDGIGQSWNSGECCDPASTNKSIDVDDIGFLRSIITFFETKYCIESSKIYTTGMSNGAMQAYRVGCEMADVIAAVAIVEGCLEFLPCVPSRPLPMFILHGDSDINIPYLGGVGCGVTGLNYTSVPVSVSLNISSKSNDNFHMTKSKAGTFVTANGCTCPFESGVAGTCGQSALFEDGTKCFYFGSCTGGVNVTFCRIFAGGHSWSGSTVTGNILQNCNKSIGAFPASKQIWGFFSAQTLPAPPPTTTTTSSAATTTAASSTSTSASASSTSSSSAASSTGTSSSASSTTSSPTSPPSSSSSAASSTSSSPSSNSGGESTTGTPSSDAHSLTFAPVAVLLALMLRI